MANAVYILCALTSATCAFLLLAGYRKTGSGLLLWSGLCFVGLALNNLFLVEDLILSPELDFSVARNLSGAVGVCLLLYGLLWKQSINPTGEE